MAAASDSRTAILRKVNRIVLKLGSYVLTTPSWKLDRKVLTDVTGTVAGAHSAGRDVLLVSSGAIAAGMGVLGLKERPRVIAQEQAAAAVGQIRLMGIYERMLRRYNITAAQVLLTHEDLRSRARFLNARRTLVSLLEFGAVPVINENDTTVVEEIRFGDNDNLASLVTNLVQADILVILTDIDGLYDRDPRTCAQARLIPVVEKIDHSVEALAVGTRHTISRGGMATKLSAAKTAARFGIPTIIANGKRPGNLERILAGEPVGTLILPQQNKLASRKHWIAYMLKPRGVLCVDDGAKQAMLQHRRSLLPSGIISSEGDFDAGEAVICRDSRGVEFARGLTAYSAREIEKIRGTKTSQIKEILGRDTRVEVINRDDLVTLPEDERT